MSHLAASSSVQHAEGAHLIVRGGVPLAGKVVPSANKNAVLPVLCASLLTREPVHLRGVPDITDVRKLLHFFEEIGSDVHADFERGIVHLHHRHIAFDPTRQRLPHEMRSSIMLVPPLIARFGVARIEDEVKGCTLGVREIDPHVDVLRAFGRVSSETTSMATSCVVARRFGPTNIGSTTPR